MWPEMDWARFKELIHALPSTEETPSLPVDIEE
jgi:hypothetical protein